MLEFSLGAIQFALGDLPASTVPSARLTPAIAAQEKWGWRLAANANPTSPATLFEAIDLSARLGLLYLGASGIQQVSPELPKNFDETLAGDDLRNIRLKLDSAGVRLLTYAPARFPMDASSQRRLFEFGRKMGIEVLWGSPPPETLDGLSKLCDEFDLRLAIRGCGSTVPRPYRTPGRILKACEGRSLRLGVFGDLGDWRSSGIDPVVAIRTLKNRMFVLQLRDFEKPGRQGREVPLGMGTGMAQACLDSILHQGLNPPLFMLDCSIPAAENVPQLAKSIGFFNLQSLKSHQP
jgi:sugar phosphate isomerase/epimerase